MTVQRKKTSKVTKAKQIAARPARSPRKKSVPLKALPAPEPGPNPECGVSGGGRGRVDIIGRKPKRPIRIDPDLTEGHPGYEESGDSGLSVIQRFAKTKSVKAPRPTKRK